MRRTGGLIISRVPLESVTIRYPDGFEIEMTVGRFNSKKDGVNLFFERRWPNGESLMDRMEMKCGESIGLPGDGDEEETLLIPMEITDGKLIVRTVADKSILVIRTELLRPELRKRRKLNAK